MTETTVKICVDCQFWELNPFPGPCETDNYCTKFVKNKAPDKISGHIRRVGRKPCWLMRSVLFGKCGPEGKLYEPKNDNEGIL